MLTKDVYHILVGTPNRILKLADMGILKFDKLAFFVVETRSVLFLEFCIFRTEFSWKIFRFQTAKHDNIFEMKDTQLDIINFYVKHINPFVVKNQTKISLY